MIETVVTIRNGKRQSHEQSILEFAGLRNATADIDNGELLITTTGSRKQHLAFIKRLMKELEKELAQEVDWNAMKHPELRKEMV